MKKAFTLAELLIALSIVGIIAVITIPAVMRNTFTKTNIAVIQQTYTNLSDSLKSLMLEQRVQSIEDLDFSSYDADSLAEAFMKQNFDIMKFCGDSITECFAESYKDIEGTSRSNVLSSHDSTVTFILANGASIAMNPDIGGYIFIDANNVKTPNVLGMDLFVLYINSNGELVTSSEIDDDSSSLLSDCKSFDGNWVTCFAFLQQNNWKMDY